MNKIIMIMVAAMTMFSTTAFAQMSKKQIKANEKIVKAEMKRLAKEGWKTTPGAQPLAIQYNKALVKLAEEDEEGYPMYLTGEAMSIGGTYDAAKMQATALAKVNLAQELETEIKGYIENQLSNKQLDEEEAASIAKTVSSSMERISAKLGRVIPLVECYRDKANKNKEVFVRIAYSAKKAKQMAKETVKEALQDESEALSKKVEEMDW